MAKNERILQIILRVVGCTGLLAFPCALLPFEWMSAIHQWLGLGEMPVGPIVDYLARSVSFFYGMTSAILLLCSTDLTRFRPVIRLSGALAFLLGALLLVVDFTAGMPPWWTFGEGSFNMAVGAVIWFLAGRVVEARQ